MIVPTSTRLGRRGVTLLEVMVSLTIFLFSIVAIAHLISVGAEQAVAVQEESRATQLCQSKLAEVVWGIEPLGSSGGSFDETDWSWSQESTQGDLTGLWNVKVTVRKEHSDGSAYEFSLSQMVLDPSYRGSTFDTPPATADTSSTNATGSSTPATTTPGATTPAATAPGGGGMTRPTTPSMGTPPTTGGGTTRPSSGTTPTTGGTTKPSNSTTGPRTGP
jgi:prepilin-type N-terminal cleavage/methylation domain-containing protein